MKKKSLTILTIILVICTTITYAQHEVINMKKYYHHVNTAEIQITNELYGHALENFLSAKEYNPLFLSDLRNAFACAVKLNKYDIATIFVGEMIEMGVPLAFFEKTAIYSKFTQSRKWRKCKTKKLYKLKPKYNLNLRKKIDSLLVMDQKVRKFPQKDSVRHVDSLVKEELNEIFKKYGYPGERLIGVSMVNDTTFHSWSSFDILLIHLIKSNKEKYIEFLQENVLNGKMRNTDYKSHSKNFPQFEKYKLNCFQPVQGLIIQVGSELMTCCCEDEEKINKKRLEFYLDSLVNERIKNEFHYEKNKNFLLGGGIFVYKVNKDEYPIIKKELEENGFIVYKKLENDNSYIK